MSFDLNNVPKEPRAGKLSAAKIAFILAALFFVLARLWRLTASCLWFDEVFSVHAARYSWLGLVKFVAADIIHPPLFYGLLKLWLAVGGESLLWLRMFPILFSVATILPFWLLCRELSLKPAETNLALVLMGASGFLIKYAQEVRMYSVLFFLSVLSLWLFFRFLNTESSSKKSLLALAAVNLLLVYTHYYGWLVVLVQAIVMVFATRRKIGSFLLTVVGLVLSYLPWLYALTIWREPGRGLSQNLGWISRPGLGDIGRYFVLLGQPFLFAQSTADYAYIALTPWLLFLMFGIPVIFLCWRLTKRQEQSLQAWLLVFALAPVLLAFVLSWLLPYPIWGTRHLIIAAAPCFLFIAIAVLRLRPDWIRVAVLLVMGCWFLLAGAVVLLKPAPMLSWCAWEPLLAQASQDTNSPPAEIFAFEDLVAYHVWFAATHTVGAHPRVTVIKGAAVGEDPAYFLPRRFDEIKIGDQSLITGDHIWLAFRAPRWDETRAPVSTLKSMGYQTGRVLSMPAQGEQAYLVEFRRSP